MYNSPPPGAAVAGVIGIGGGTLAVTGFNTLSLGIIAALLIVGGLVLLRIAVLARTERESAAPAT
ncbi:MAG TPA: hypothetical protein VNQ33_10800 [Acidimicrobiales bacterium]|nr:hypothetical protein [Acidimicrobiales bacterium]